MNLEERLKKNIEEKQISPKSKMSCLFAECMVWSTSIFFVVLGGVDLSTFIYTIKTKSHHTCAITRDGFSSLVFESIPFVWLALLFLFVFSTYYLFRKTKKGYRYDFYKVILTVSLSTILFGIIFYILGIGQMCESTVEAILLKIF